MICSNNFVWLHFPKCAGTKIENIFNTYFAKQDDLHLDPVGINNDPTIGWHDSIDEREAKNKGFELGDRDVIVSVRRLPSWLISRFCFELKRSPDLPHDKNKLLEGRFLEANGYENHADYYMHRYIPERILESSKVLFLRTEFFEEDFKAIFSKYIDIDMIPDDLYKAHLNASESCLPDEFIKKLNSADFSEAAPYWCKVENKAYGQ